MAPTSSSANGRDQENDAHVALIATFYAAFAEGDAETMVACYHPDVVFADPGFGQLRGDDAKNMWRMLCRSAKDLVVATTDIAAADGRGQAHWEADYTFSTGRKVHNVIDAEFDFAEGLIIRHTDTFDFARWSGQAFGLPGQLIGRVPVIPQAAFQQVARRQLASYSASRQAKSV
ncbi:MAG: nuclear transport factor 2 family protein [Actinobacteria bacterium]|nr:nuclear transport factor 2 family protein [Actinomycetota bacterium]